MIALRRINRRLVKRLIILVSTFWFIGCVPKNLFTSPYATVVEDAKGSLLMATIASDGQWRFPPGHQVPDKFKKAIILFEDRGFYSHVGVSARAMLRATIQNIAAKKVVSGGSTISMQVIRLSTGRTGRSISDKFIEMIKAVRLELRYGKNEILEMYSAHAPFGGNVVGLEAASWRYYGHDVSMLSWSEAATLAILPNAPSLIHPGKNRSALLAKRNRLLKRLQEAGHMSMADLESALSEPLPDKPKALPQLTPHYLAHLQSKSYDQKRFSTRINRTFQQNANRIIERHQQVLATKGIHNTGLIVLHIPTGEVQAYVGNAVNAAQASYVDVCQAPRSTGSILKPFLYAGCMESGRLTPNMLLPDYPTRIHGYTPQNYDHSYDGMVQASTALSRSLNIPAVRLLSDYGVSRFKNDLQRLGLQSLFRPADQYGLSLILGGAEATLWDLAHAYRDLASLAQDSAHLVKHGALYHPSVAYEIVQALTQVNRPGEEQFWQQFEGRKIAWKTGTSFGSRDAWAIGLNADYIVAVWVGNADGEGVAGMTGSSVAGPILFDAFQMLPDANWFNKPVRDMRFVKMCDESGHRASNVCPNVQEMWLPTPCLSSAVCAYHKTMFMNKEGTVIRFAGQGALFEHTQFILPAAAAYYYKMRHPEYKNPPIIVSGASDVIGIVYPQKNVVLHIPKLMTGSLGEVTFEAVHLSDDAELFWFIDNVFITSTKDIHQINSLPSIGKHTLTIVDQDGRNVQSPFRVSHSNN